MPKYMSGAAQSPSQARREQNLGGGIVASLFHRPQDRFDLLQDFCWLCKSFENWQIGALVIYHSKVPLVLAGQLLDAAAVAVAEDYVLLLDENRRDGPGNRLHFQLR